MADELIVARHGESEYSRAGRVNGDISVACPLTEAGRSQADALGRRLADRTIDLCVTSEFGRTRETADIALRGRDVPRLVLPELNDPRVGSFEGTRLADYLSWRGGIGIEDRPPGGGESQLDAIRRYRAAWGRIVRRPEPVVLVIAHAFPISFLLSILEPDAPAVRNRYEIAVECCEDQEVAGAELREALRRVDEELAELSGSSGASTSAAIKRSGPAK